MATASSSMVGAQIALPTDLHEVQAFETLYRQYFGFAWASLRRLGVPNLSIDDAAQDLWVTVHRRLDSFDPTASMKAWLFGIARRIASHYRRSAQRNRRKIAALSVADPRRSDQPIGRRDLALTVERFLGRLDERKRVAFVLSELEGWSAPEIARVAGTNPNTIYSRIRLAKQQLREELTAADAEVDVEHAIDEAKRATKPPKGAAKHCWAALLPKLGTTTVATASTFGAALAKLKFAAVGAVAGSAALVGVDAALPDAPAAAEPKVALVNAPSPARTSDAAVSSPHRSEFRPAALPETPEPPVAVAAPVVVPSAKASPEPKPAPATRRRTADSAPARAPVVADEPREDHPTKLADETALLTDAKRALSQGQATQALDLVRTHSRRFPNSKLSDLRSVIEVEALCASGSRARARQRAETIVAKHPNSSAATRVRNACKS